MRCFRNARRIYAAPSTASVKNSAHNTASLTGQPIPASTGPTVSLMLCLPARITKSGAGTDTLRAREVLDNNPSMMDGQTRSNIQPGMRVRVVEKQNQRTGQLTEGVVQRI